MLNQCADACALRMQELDPRHWVVALIAFPMTL
jgi:hypothetical protein